MTVQVQESVQPVREGAAPLAELRDSLILLGFLVSSMAAYITAGLVAVRLLAGT